MRFIVTKLNPASIRSSVKDRAQILGTQPIKKDEEILTERELSVLAEFSPIAKRQNRFSFILKEGKVQLSHFSHSRWKSQSFP